MESTPPLSFRVRFAPDAVPASLKGVVMCHQETLTLLQELSSDSALGSSSKSMTPFSSSAWNHSYSGSQQHQHRFLGVCTVALIQFYRQDRRICLTRGCTYLFDNAALRSRIEEKRGVSPESSNPSHWKSVLLQFASANEADALIEVLLQGLAEEIFIPPSMPDDITEVMYSRSASRHWRESSTSSSQKDEEEEHKREKRRDRKKRASRKVLPLLPTPPSALHRNNEEEWIQPLSYDELHSSSRLRRREPASRERKETSIGAHRRDPHMEHRLNHSDASTLLVMDVKTVTTPGGSSVRHLSKSHHHFSLSPTGGKKKRREDEGGKGTERRKVKDSARHAMPSCAMVSPSPSKQKEKGEHQGTTSFMAKTPEGLQCHPKHRGSPSSSPSRSSPAGNRSHKKKNSIPKDRPSPFFPRHKERVNPSLGVLEQVEELCLNFMRFEHHRQHMMVYLHRELVRKTFQAAVLSLEESRLQKSLQQTAEFAKKRGSTSSRLPSTSHTTEEMEMKKLLERVERENQQQQLIIDKLKQERKALNEQRKALKVEQRSQLDAVSPSTEYSAVPKSVQPSSHISSSPFFGPVAAAQTNPSPSSSSVLLGRSSLPPMKIIKFRRVIPGKCWGSAFIPAGEEDIRHSALVDIALATKLNRALIEVQRVEPLGEREQRTSPVEGNRACLDEKKKRRTKKTSRTVSLAVSPHPRRGELSPPVKSTSHCRSVSKRRYRSYAEQESMQERGVTRRSRSAVSEYDEVVGEEEDDNEKEGGVRGAKGRDGGLRITAKIRFVPSPVLTSDMVRHRLRLCGFPILSSMYTHQSAFRQFQPQMVVKGSTGEGDKEHPRGEAKHGNSCSPKRKRMSPGLPHTPLRHASHAEVLSSPHPRPSPAKVARDRHGRIETGGTSGCHERGAASSYGDACGGARRLSPGGPGGGRSCSLYRSSRQTSPPSRSPSPSSPERGTQGKSKGGAHPMHRAQLHAADRTRQEGYSSSSFPYYPNVYLPPSPSYRLGVLASNPRREEYEETRRQGNHPVGLRSPYAQKAEHAERPHVKSPLWSYGPVTTAGGSAHGRENTPTLEGVCSTEAVDRALMVVAEARQRSIIMHAQRQRLAFLELEELEHVQRQQIWMEQEPIERYGIQVMALPLKYFPEAFRAVCNAEALHRDQVWKAEAQARQWLEKQRSPFLAKGLAKAKEMVRKEEATARLQHESDALSQLLDIITYDQRQRSWWGKHSAYQGSRTADKLSTMLGEVVEMEREERLGIVKHEARLRLLIEEARYEREEELYAQRLRVSAIAEPTEVSIPSRGADFSFTEPNRLPSPLKALDTVSRDSVSFPGMDQSSQSHRRRRFQSQKHVKPFHYMTFSPEDMDFKPNAESATEGILGCTINRNLEVVEISRPLSKRDGEDGDEFQTGDMILDASGQALHSLSHFREVLSHRIMLIQEEAKMEFPDLPEEEWTTNPAMQKYIEVLCDHHNFMIQVLRGCDIVQLIVKS